jgi:hypothetical protein
MSLIRPSRNLRLILGLFLTLAAGAVSGQEPAYTAQPVTYRPTVPQPEEKTTVDLAKWQARARVIYISSGAIAFTLSMIDYNLRTSFHFSGNDLHPTAIVELAQDAPVHHVSAIFHIENNAKLDVYLLNALPKHPGDLRGATPLVCAVRQTDIAQAAIDFTPTNARYVAFQWTRSKSTRMPFRVAEISVLASLQPDQVPPLFPDVELHFPGETGEDFSNKLGTPADPPVISPSSP